MRGEKRRMPLCWLGQTSGDGRRFDGLVVGLLPLPIIEPGEYRGLLDEPMCGWIRAVESGSDGRVWAVCEFLREVDESLVLGMDAIGTPEFDCVEFGPDGSCVDGLLRFERCEVRAATLQPAEGFLWPAWLAEERGGVVAVATGPLVVPAAQGPCPGVWRGRQLAGAWLRRCELSAGHDGAHRISLPGSRFTWTAGDR